MHPLARSGFDQSGASGLYDRARPSYPTDAAEAILTAPTARAGADGKTDKLSVVELGSGTGIATRALLAQADGRIARLVAVEPSTGMREGWEKAISRVRQTLPDVELKTVDGAFEKFDAGQDNDVVLVAQVGTVHALKWDAHSTDPAHFVHLTPAASTPGLALDARLLKGDR